MTRQIQYEAGTMVLQRDPRPGDKFVRPGHLRRREFIKLLGSVGTAWPLVARAQQSAMPVIGLLGSPSAQEFAGPLAAFRQGLKEAGYREGQNVAIEYRWANDQMNRLPALAAELVHSQVALIAVLGGLPPSLAVKAATTKIPIVFATSADPVKTGLVASLSRPGGNLTGATTLNVEVGPKRLEMLREAVPAATSFALLVNPNNPFFAENLAKDLRAAGQTFGLQIQVLEARTESELETAFTAVVQAGVGGLVIGPDTFFTTRSAQLAALSLRYAVPTIYQYREFTAAGGLMSYGGSISDQYRIAGNYTGRILKGDKPSDLPVQQSTKIEFFINLKSARQLGLTIPQPLLGRADELIE
jgi:putative tryptophan/tyrosine transport system substrate-binding protein